MAQPAAVATVPGANARANEKTGVETFERSVLLECGTEHPERAVPGGSPTASETAAAETVGRQVSVATNPSRGNRNPFVQAPFPVRAQMKRMDFWND